MAKEGKSDQAEKLFRECEKLRQDKASDIDTIIEEMHQNHDYEKTMAEVRKAMQDKLWSHARELLNNAQKIKGVATDEITVLITQTAIARTSNKARPRPHRETGAVPWAITRWPSTTIRATRSTNSWTKPRRKQVDNELADNADLRCRRGLATRGGAARNTPAARGGPDHDAPVHCRAGWAGVLRV